MNAEALIAKVQETNSMVSKLLEEIDHNIEEHKHIGAEIDELIRRMEEITA